ncbi:MAG: DUF6198 family protein [Methanocorpusculum sp.]|nr:DUF6198 family protein [Methanocorpusculum sp.]
MPKLSLKQTALCIAGIFIMAVGVSLSVKADLGTSPISCLPNVLSLALPLSIGGFTFIMNICFVLAQIAILRKRFRPFQLLQIPMIFVFSVFIDFTMFLLTPLAPDFYPVQFFVMILSCAVLALGITILIKADVLMMAGDALIRVISQEAHKKFGNVKICFDVTLVVMSVIVSFALLGGLYGVREGSVIAAVLVGTIVKLYQKMPVFR